MELHTYNTPDEVIRNLADFIVNDAQKVLQTKYRYAIALSGGSSPKKLYELLSAEYNDLAIWDKIDFFFGDERNVPDDSPDSNFLMAKQTLFEPLQIYPTRVYAVNTRHEPAIAAAEYANTINEYFTGTEKSFDMMLLGLGDNSHTASLFPHTPILDEEKATVKEVWLDDQQVYRISMTAPLINASVQTVFLVYGKGKAEAVNAVINGERNIPEHPAQLIHPANGNLHWFLDKDAASAL